MPTEPKRSELVDPERQSELASVDEEIFSTSHLLHGIGKRSAEGLFLGVGSQGIQIILTLSGTIVLARLLVPEDFGIVAMAAVVAAILTVIGDFGLSSAIIQRTRITHRQVSTLFWLNMSAGLAIGLVLVAISPLVALLYGESRLVLITMGQGGVLFIATIGSQHSAILRRQMRFRSFSIITVTSAAIGITAGITAAANGAGYWSLLIMPFANSLASVVLKFAIVGWIPGRPGWDSSIKEMIGFGANVTGSAFVQKISRQLDNFLVGRFIGAASLGYYTKAYSLMIAPPRQVISPMRLVFLPGLSSLKSNPEKYRSYYRLMVLGTASFVLPGILFFMIVAEPLVDVLLGEQWQPAARVFQYLAPAALFGTLSMVGPVYRSWGHVNRELRWEMYSVPVTISGFVIGVFFGIEGVAIGFSITRIALFYPSLIYAFKGTPIQVSDFHNAFWRPLAASLGASAAVLVLVNAVDFSSDPETLAVTLLVFAGVYILLWSLMPGGIQLLARGRATVAQFR